MTLEGLTAMIAELELLAVEAGVGQAAHYLRMALMEADRQATEGNESWPIQSRRTT